MIIRALALHLILSWTKQISTLTRHRNYFQAHSKQLYRLSEFFIINAECRILIFCRDTHTYLKYHHEQCIGAIADYLEQTSQFLDALQREAGDQGSDDVSDSKAVFLGRLTRGIALTSTDLLAAFTHTAPNNSSQYTSALPSHGDRGMSSFCLIRTYSDNTLTCFHISASLPGHSEQIYRSIS
jgi:hypothetical protein